MNILNKSFLGLFIFGACGKNVNNSDILSINIDNNAIKQKKLDNLIVNTLQKNNISRALLIDNQTIRLYVNDYSIFNIDDIKLKNIDNNVINIDFVIKNNTFIDLKFNKIDINTNYFIEYKNADDKKIVWVKLSTELLNNEFFYNNNDLGSTFIDNKNVKLKLWSPPATNVNVNIYDKNDQNKKLFSKKLQKNNKGVWEVNINSLEIGKKSIDGYFYQYEVTAYGQTKLALDPYAKSMAAFDPSGSDKIGKAAIINYKKTNPFFFGFDRYTNKRKMLNNADVIAYEIHVRDFTSDSNSKVSSENRGTYKGFTEKIGHLAKLGITHVQLLPIQNYYTVNENDRKYSDSNNEKPNYNWGYDPHNYFTPEGWLSTDANNPYTRIKELKALIRDLHFNNIGIIMDVVYNHTYNIEVFENVCPNCYYRLNDNGDISYKTGAGPSIETRNKMVKKLIIDSLKYYVDEFHIDGFRFDLLGFIDNETIKEAKKVLGNHIIFQGEAWEFSDLSSHEATTKSNLPDIKLAAFSDTTRDAFAGPMQFQGFVQGSSLMNNKVRSGIIGNIQKYNDDYDNDQNPDVNISTDSYDRFARTPVENLNYVDIHDGFTLWDKLNLSNKSNKIERIQMVKMAMAMLFTSQGKIILNGGVEMARTKPLAIKDPELNRAHTSDLVTADDDLPDVKYYHENSYKSSDYTNMLRWSRLKDKEIEDMTKYLQGLIYLKRTIPALRLTNAEDVNKYVKFFDIKKTDIENQNPSLAGYKTFAEVPELTIDFINAKPNTKWYLAGENNVGENQNPENNNFFIDVDDTGKGTIFFSKENIEKFDLKAWADPQNLQIKLISIPGQWNSHPNSYSDMGNNTIKPNFIQKGNKITVDLSKINHVPGMTISTEKPLIAYEINNSLVQQNYNFLYYQKFNKLLIIHNATNEWQVLENKSITNAKNWKVLVDDKNVDAYYGLKITKVKISNNKVTVPPRSSVVIAK